MAWTRSEPDLLVVVIWALAVGLVALARQDFIGDGLRYLDQIVTSGRPVPGQPRWWLFPALLFVLERPLVLAGLVRDQASAIPPFLALDWFSGLVYLFALRLWLLARGHTQSVRRAPALFLAAVTGAFLIVTSDTAEPAAAAAIALLGLAMGAHHALRLQHPLRGALIASAGIALATLIYQGLAMAVFLLPLALGFRNLARREVAATVAGVLLLAPIALFAGLVAEGNQPAHAVERMLVGEENAAFRGWLKGSPLTSYAAAVVAGPAQGLIPIPNFSGLNDLLGQLRSRATLPKGLFDVVLLAVANLVLLAVFVPAIRRRDTALLLAFVGIALLPMYREQYSYFKLWVLLPAVLAIGAASVRWTHVVAAACIVGLLNGRGLLVDVLNGRATYAAMVPVYQTLDKNACWLSKSWIPPISYQWPGSITSLITILASGSGDNQAAIATENTARLESSLAGCFCNGSTVMTPDMTVDQAASVREVTDYYGFSALHLEPLLWSPDKGGVVIDRPGLRVSQYGRQAQASSCQRLGGLAGPKSS